MILSDNKISLPVVEGNTEELKPHQVVALNTDGFLAPKETGNRYYPLYIQGISADCREGEIMLDGIAEVEITSGETFEAGQAVSVVPTTGLVVAGGAVTDAEYLGTAMGPENGSFVSVHLK